ncbi:TetR/AcrR family transcriptional regulator [Lactococcus protaetiae]|uniref:TetR/AcrR family transcriptional regulator n=1 Tax=Lactococcus protaetiae TaxID=2592653 RepID=A0A514Z720_9LACT|nr:TetR/AcrR family transcriptional regulator [Lactococcus protaetiae]MCL2112435.1 TetR/AcrR family transcriptional regulator [Streptococcaceae bacterium]QDK70381.1 TetR/AcrR family transcriptional regulator [Lactococcus protaetiae]
MARIALTREKIVQATVELAGKIGLGNVSFPRLAEYFGIKAPSLYNHFKNMEEVRVATAVYLQRALNYELTHAMVGLNPLDALRAYAESYKKFAEQYESVYELVNVIHQTNNAELEFLAKENIRLVRRSLDNFNLTEDENFHISRMFRSTLHGFITLTQLGYFRNSGSISKEESFDYMVNQLLAPLALRKP